jgi:cell division protein FtsB
MPIYAKDRGFSLRMPTPKHWGWTGLLLGVLGALALLGLGQKNIWQLWQLSQEQQQLATHNLSLKHSNEHLQQQIDCLRHDPKAIEPIARQELGLVYPEEWVYRFVSSAKLNAASKPLSPSANQQP